ncbi:MAG: hypothetical protein ACK56I_36050 [bacterium]
MENKSQAEERRRRLAESVANIRRRGVRPALRCWIEAMEDRETPEPLQAEYPLKSPN